MARLQVIRFSGMTRLLECPATAKRGMASHWWQQLSSSALQSCPPPDRGEPEAVLLIGVILAPRSLLLSSSVAPLQLLQIFLILPLATAGRTHSRTHAPHVSSWHGAGATAQEPIMG